MRPEETIDFHLKSAWHAIARMYNQQAARFGGTMSIGFVLLNIRDEGTQATKIAPLMGLEARSLTRILKRLEVEELIYKKKDPKDGRAVLVFLTTEGKKKRELAKDTVKEFNTYLRQHISQKKLDNLFEVVAEINHLVESNNIFSQSKLNG